MISCKITELKQFMGKLLATDCFDAFLLEEALITTYNTFTIDGHIQKDFFTTEEWDDASIRPYALSSWATMRPLCFSLIKGKKTPVNMKFVLHLKPDYTEKLLRENGAASLALSVRAFVVNIRYEDGNMTCITGTALAGFVPDKTLDHLWDKAFLLFLEKHGISYERQI